MTKQPSHFSDQRGFALAYIAVTLTCLILFTGLAVDSGRSYVVKAQLTKAVDGAALAAARALNSGNPKGAAAQIFRANFPIGYLGTTSSTDPLTDLSFFSSAVDSVSGVNVVTVTAQAVLPTTFMQLANFNQVTVRATGEATRRMVDLSLVIDGSSSIFGQWGAVRDAARDFISKFDQNNDRLSLTTFGNGAAVLYPMAQSRGFNKTALMAAVPDLLPNGSTNMAEGLYRGWDQLRFVPNGSQSGLRVIVLFTDGASNGVSGNYDAKPGVSTALRTYDFPKRPPDLTNQTHNDPHIEGLYYASTGAQALAAPATLTMACPAAPANGAFKVAPCIDTITAVPSLPIGNQSWHTTSVSSGMPTSFPLQSNTLKVQGFSQSTMRPLHNLNLVNPLAIASRTGIGRYPADVFNINNAARNLVEIMADAARAETSGDYRIRIYTIGMGDLVTLNLGTIPEPSSDILRRMANDPTSANVDHNPAQLDGKYFPAPTGADVQAAFEGIQNQILRLSK
jgi:Mg-chelatase subunit ChlD